MYHRTDNEIRDLTLKIAEYIINNDSTIRNTAQHFGIGKSFTHVLVTKNLALYNQPKIYSEVASILKSHKSYEWKAIHNNLPRSSKK